LPKRHHVELEDACGITVVAFRAVHTVDVDKQARDTARSTIR
jgi:hypothetical protein